MYSGLGADHKMLGYSFWRAGIARASALALFLVILPTLVGISAWLTSGGAAAQPNSVNVDKLLCDATGAACGAASIPAGATVTYKITLTNVAGGTLAVDLKDTFPPGFNMTGATCGANNLPVISSSGTTNILGTISLGSTQVVCLIKGWFNLVPGTTNNTNNQIEAIEHTSQQVLGISPKTSGQVDQTKPIPTDLQVQKSATWAGNPAALDISSSPGVIHYKITITNTGTSAAQDVDLAAIFALQDKLAIPGTGVPLKATFVAGSGLCVPAGPNCLDAVPDPNPTFNHSPLTVSATAFTSATADFIQWKFPAGSLGTLPHGATITLTYDVKVERLPTIHCVKQLNGDFLRNEAHISLTLPPAAGGQATTLHDTSNSNNTATSADVPIFTGAQVIDPGCGVVNPPKPALQLTKIQTSPSPSTVMPWGTDVIYTITVKNVTSGASARTISNIDVLDSVIEGLGTPPFTARLVSGFCSPTICSNSAANTPAAPPGNTQNLVGYYDTKWMYRTTMFASSTTQLAPGQTASFWLKLRYSDPKCDSYPSIDPKVVTNRVLLTYKDPVNGVTTLAAFADTLLQRPKACPFKVTKAVNPASTNQIIFNQWVTYDVTFTNWDSTLARTVGTVADMVRITIPNYASSLTVDYNYSCSGSGVSGFTPLSATGTVSAVYTSLPQQGVPVLHNTTPVTFQPLATLTCTVKIRVKPPITGDPFCAQTGAIENVALMDVSQFYNANFPWPAGSVPGNAADPPPLALPRCFNLVVEKHVISPPGGWTSPSGVPGPLVYQLKITNNGDAFSGYGPGNASNSWNGPILRDNLQTGYVPSSVVSTPPCSNSSSAACTWLQGPVSNPFRMGIRAMAHGQAIVTDITVMAPPPAYPKPEICNEARANIRHDATTNPAGLHANDWYIWDSTVLEGKACEPVVDTSAMTVTKVIDNQTGMTLPAGLSFVVNVNCGTPWAFPATSLTLTQSAPTKTVGGIPVGNACFVTEPTQPASGVKCANGTQATWGTPIVKPVPLTIQLDKTQNVVTVTNTLTCPKPTGTLIVIKTIYNPDNAPLANVNFPISITCGTATTQPPFNQGNLTNTVSGLASGTQCSVSEGVLPQIVCRNGATAVWGQPVFTPNPATVTIGSGNTQVTVANGLKCPSTSPTGSLTVIKTIYNPDNAPLANVNFPITITCGTATSQPTFNQGNNLTNTVSGLAAGTQCTVTEGTLPPVTCRNGATAVWYAATFTPNPAAVTIGTGNSQVTVANALKCPSTPTGSVTFIKVIDNPQGINIPAGTTFTVNVTCGTTVTPVTLTTPNQLSQTVSGISLFQCTVNEATPPQIPCPDGTFATWAQPIYTPSAAGQPVSETVTNKLTCGGGTPTGGSVQVYKTVFVDGMDMVAGFTEPNNAPSWVQPVVGFPITVTCGTAAPVPGSLDASNNWNTTVSNLPLGTCTVAEVQPPPAQWPGSDCHWVTSYPQGQQVTITASGAPVVEIRNEQICSEAGPNQTEFNVTKSVYINGSWTNWNVTIDFPTQITCNGSQQTVPLGPANNFEWVQILSVGSTCQAQETQPSLVGTPYANCTWTGQDYTLIETNSVPNVTLSAGQTVNLSQAEHRYVIDIGNYLACPVMIQVPSGTINPVQKIPVTIDGPCVDKPRRERTDDNGQVRLSGLRPGECRVTLPVDSIRRANTREPDQRSGPDIDVGIGIDVGGSSGGSQRTRERPPREGVNGEPARRAPERNRGGNRSRGGSGSSITGGISIGIPLGGGSSKPTPGRGGGGFILTVDAGGAPVERGLPCCGPKGPTRGVSVRFKVPVGTSSARITAARAQRPAR